MEPVPQRLPFRTRLKIARLKLLISIATSITESQAFKRALLIVLKPVVYVGLMIFVSRLAFGYTPKWLGEVSPQASQSLAQLEETRNKPIRSNLTDREHAALQATTWGMAGAGLVIEVAIATSSKTLGPAMSVAAGCFATAIPLLITFGFVQSHQFNPAKDRPTTTQEAIKLAALIYGTQFLFCVGLTAMLFDFNRIVAVAFLVGSWLALRSFKRFTISRPTPQVSAPDEPAAVVPTKALPLEPAIPPTTNTEEMQCLGDDKR
jgi:hypothetical protein